MLALDQSLTGSAVVITEAPGASELAGQARFATKFISQQGQVMALRVSKR